MQNKLQELTDKLYNEGLTRGKEEGERILEDAKKKAEEIIASAKAEAETIREMAEKEAADLKAKTESDVRMASEQCLQATKGELESLLVNAVCSKKTDAALSDRDFMKEVISTVASRFSATEGVDMQLILPESLRNDLEEWVSGELAGTLEKGVSASFSKKVSGGFSIGPKDGSWFISLKDETFRELIAGYLRPVTRKLLFG